jgi:hypothetical protein
MRGVEIERAPETRMSCVRQRTLNGTLRESCGLIADEAKVLASPRNAATVCLTNEVCRTRRTSFAQVARGVRQGFAPASGAADFISERAGGDVFRRITHTESETMNTRAITASIDTRDGAVSAEFHIDTGRLRILERGMLRVELFAPHSWFTIASVAGNSRYGTRPCERDLQLVVESYIMQRFGVNAVRADYSRAMISRSPMPQVRSL